MLGTDAGDVMARSAADGSLAWDKVIGAAPLSASLLEADGRLYAGSQDGTFAALDVRTGEQLWRRADLGGAVTRGAALDGGVVFVGVTGGKFFALDAATGTERWHLDLGAGEVGTPEVGPGTIYVARNLLAPDGSHDAVAIDRATHTIRWTFRTPTGKQAYPAALAHGLFDVVTDDGHIYALDAESGALRWNAEAASSPLGTLGSIVGNVLYVTTSDRNVQAFDATTGAHLWTVVVAGVPTQAAVVDGTVFAYVKPGGPTLPEVIAHAHGLGFTISDVSVKETTLETVFINLTGRELRE
jgi:outer membrane protein assembly factor BamB